MAAKTIKIFLASSKELAEDRVYIGDFISNKLNNIYEPYGICVKCVKWEDLEEAYTGERTQDMYNRSVRDCDFFVALFYTKAGRFTLEELDTAVETQKTNKKPKIGIYIKFLDDKTKETAELRDFKDRVLNKMQHFTVPDYKQLDALKLSIALQVASVQLNIDLKPEFRGSSLYINSQNVADFDNIPFVANNIDFQAKKDKLNKLKKEIEDTRSAIGQMPDIEVLKQAKELMVNGLESKLAEYNNIKEEIEKEKIQFFNTAQRITVLQSETISERMKRAIEAFDNGEVHKANVILDESEKDADEALVGILQSKERGRISVDELVTKTDIMMSDSSLPMAERITRTEEIYEKAYKLAKECDYEEEKYVDLLFKYANFLSDIRKYKKSLRYYNELLVSSRKYAYKEQDVNGCFLSQILSNIAGVHKDLNQLDLAEEEYMEAIGIYRKSTENDKDNSMRLAGTLHDFACLCMDTKQFNQAKELYGESLSIIRKFRDDNNAYDNYMLASIL